MPYHITIVYLVGTNNSNADGKSRQAWNDKVCEVKDPSPHLPKIEDSMVDLVGGVVLPAGVWS